jgi:hypothetical protein
MLAKGSHGSHAHFSGGHFRHGFRGHHRHSRGYGDWSGSAESGGCWEWNGYKYVFVCRDDNGY